MSISVFFMDCRSKQVWIKKLFARAVRICDFPCTEDSKTLLQGIFFPPIMPRRKNPAGGSAKGDKRTEAGRESGSGASTNEIDLIGEDLLQNILSRLPALTFASAACVSRTWSSLCNRVLSRPKLSSAFSLHPNPEVPTLYQLLRTCRNPTLLFFPPLFFFFFWFRSNYLKRWTLCRERHARRTIEKRNRNAGAVSEWFPNSVVEYIYAQPQGLVWLVSGLAPHLID